MGNGTAIWRSWRWVRHQWRAWRSYQRRTHAAFALVALLSLGVFEPLICIIHCQFWLPFALQNYFASQHHHHHMQLAGVAGATSTTHPPGAAVISAATQPDGCPLYRGNSSGAPISPPPSPVHEVTLPLMLLVLVVLLVAVQLTPPLTGPPRVFIPVPLRPPIPIAG